MANPGGGRKLDSRWSDAIRLAVMRDAEGDGKGRRHIDVLAEKLVIMASEGDVQALKEIGDRLEGKPKQAIDMTSDNTTKIISDKPLTAEEWAAQYGAEIAPKPNGKAH